MKAKWLRGRVLSVSVKTCFKKPFAVEEIIPQTEGFSVVVTGAKGIAIQEWKTEKTQLTRERESLYGQYKPLDKEMSRLLAVKHCAEIVMKGEQNREHEQPQEIVP